MKAVPNDLISTLCRYLPMLVDNIDKGAVQKSIRLSNAVRVTKYIILPKLKRINNDKSNTINKSDLR